MGRRAAGPVVLSPRKFVPYRGRRFLEVAKRRLRDPAQPALALSPKISHPAVIGFAQGALALGFLYDRPEKKRRIKDLRLDAELVHVSEPRLDA